MALLDKAETRLILLVAPAGYGKTTLARQWIETQQEHAWYQATPASRDIAALALGLADASTSVIPQAAEELRSQLKASADPSAKPEALANDLATTLAAWPDHAWLVIDDYHSLADSESAEMFMATLMANTQMRVLVASRARPSWVTAKNLLYGDIAEIGRTALAMTHSEAAETLAQTHDDMPGLVSLAEGWPAVIGLAALLPAPIAPDGTDVPETLHEYFAEELYHGLDDDLRWSVFQLSLLPTIDDSIVHVLFGNQSSSVLERAYRRGFLTGVAGAYEMHPLLRDFLHTKTADFERTSVKAVAATVASAYLEASRWDEAVALAEAFQLGDLKLRVLSDALDDILAQGRLATLKRWLSSAQVIAPTAYIVRLAEIEIEFRTGNWADAGAKAAQLARAVDPSDPLASRIYLRAGQIADLDDRLEEALDLFTESRNAAQTPADSRRALWSRFLSLTDLEEHEMAVDALRELGELSPLGADDLLRQNQGELHLAIRWGGVGNALARLPNALDLVEHSKDPIVRTGFLQTYGTALAQVARYHDAEKIAKRQLQEARRFKLEWVLPHALEMQALVYTGLRDFTAALQTLGEAHRLAAKQGNIHTQVNVTALTARIHLCRGAPERAMKVLETRAPRFTSRGMEGDYLATRAFALACSGRPEQAARLIAESEAITSHVEARVLRDFARAVASSFEDARQQVDEALLATALQTVRHTGHIDGWVCAYRAFPPLLRAVYDLKAADTDAFVTAAHRLDPRLTERFGVKATSAHRPSSGQLTPREREILDLVRQGLSNRDIARTLWIAESTVKVHVRHILEKLGARSRTEAVALASRDG